MRFGEGEKIWASDNRQQFEQGENIEDYEKLPEIIGGWVEVVKNEKKQKWFEAQKVQESLSGLYMELLQKINQNPENALQGIKGIDMFYRRIFLDMEFYDSSHGWDFDAFKTGILGEYALAKCLTDSGHRVYLPTKDDNHRLKVDLWDEDSVSPYILGIQVKVSQWGKERKPQFISPRFYTASESLPAGSERLKKLSYQASAMLRNTEDFINVLPYFGFIPGSCFHYMTGNPTEAMSEEIKRVLPSLREDLRK